VKLMAEVKVQNPSINTHKLHHPPGPANIYERKTRKKHLIYTGATCSNEEEDP